MPRRVQLAVLIAFIGHGLFIMTARYRLSYDAYTHMLFANHYAQDWFSLWETRWYTGFTVVSYPPLTHQLIALFIPILGFDKAFALILWIVTSLYPLGIYAFSRIFTGKTSASYAALTAALLLPIYVTAHIFGQLPFITSTLTALFAAASLNRYLRDGGIHNFTLSVALITTSVAMHHATLIVQPFLIFAVTVNNLLQNKKQDRKLWWSLFKRLFLFGTVSIVTSLLVILPFWQWGANQFMQTPIDHLSRHNFITDPLAFVIFFFPLYGPFIVLIPFLFRKWHPRLIGLFISFAMLFLLGLGGTTPLPHFFFGDSWEWLTYDRFAFWASLTLTPFFGILFIRLKKKQRVNPKPGVASPKKSIISTLTFSFFAVTVLIAWFMPIVFPFQPKTVDMQPIVDFLNEGDHSQWRYVTFGFGDQFAYLNLLTQATTIDGSYHTARTLPELRESRIGQIDTSYWALNGMTAVVPILQKSGERSVRWGFINLNTLEAMPLHWGEIHRNPFIPLLNELGWNKIKSLDDGVLVYENLNAAPLVPIQTPITPPITSFIWGVFPILAFVTALSLGTLRVYPIQAKWVIQRIHSFLIGFIPIALCFWVYRTIGEFSHPRVYFTYDNALFFLSDALSVLAVTLWLTVKITQPSFFFLLSSAQTNSSHFLRKFTLHPSAFILPLFTFCLFATISTLWSDDWHTSLYIALHFWLVFLLALSLRDWHESWKFAMFGLCVALSIELIVGFTEFTLQSTAFLEPLDMKWPGILDPSMRGASVVQLADGLHILRAYGTLPHPNILGGFTFILLLGPIALFIRKDKPNQFAALLIAPGISLLALTFSRSAWLALIAFFLILILKSKYFNRNQLTLLLVISILSAVFTLLPYRQFVQARTTNTTSHSEEFSLIGRAWLNQEALQMIRERPLTGVGIGTFIIELSQRAGEGYIIEPVHNIFLLSGAELGLPGFLLVIAIVISITLQIIKTKSPQAILVSAILTGLGVISLFDHYLWTLAPGRMMLGLTLGLWAGRIAQENTY